MSIERLGVHCVGNRITETLYQGENRLVHSMCVNSTTKCNDSDCGMSRSYRAPANGAERMRAYDRLVRGLNARTY